MVTRYPRTHLRTRRAVQADIDSLLATLRSRAKNGLHLGCGPDQIVGLINCDLYDPNADRRIGVTDLGVFPSASVDYIEAHHVIEHLSFCETEVALLEWARVAVRDCTLVVSCPDFGRLVRRWGRRPADRWTETIRMFYGSQEHEGMFHKSGYTDARLRDLLRGHNFEPEFSYTPYPPRPTPSLFMIARRI